MKISKVDHFKSAVAKNNQNIQGILYKDPGRGAESIDNRIDSLSRSAKILYKCFTPVQRGQEPKRPAVNCTDQMKKNYEIKKENFDRRKVAKKKESKINNFFQELLFSKVNKERTVKDSKEVLEYLKSSRLQTPLSKSEMNDFVELYLRKSLITVKYGAIAILMNAGAKTISEDDQESIISFVEYVKKDYNRQGSKEYKKMVRTSIEHQNMVIQLEDKKFQLPVPAISNEKKKEKPNKKEGAKEFLRLYANIDERIRTDVLRKARRVIDLYFYAPEYQPGVELILPKEVDTTEFDIWKKHEEGKTKQGAFVPVNDKLRRAYSENEKIDSVEQVRLRAELKKAIDEKNKECYRTCLNLIKKDTDNLFFEDECVNIFLVDHVQSTIDRLLENRLLENLFKLDNAYLCEKVWKDLLEYISKKMIAIGKEIYHFGMEDLQIKGREITIGVPNKTLQDCISSFDYELIKAKETLQRECAVKVAFAANNLATAIIIPTERDSDLLLLKEDKISQFLKSKEEGETVKSILQYFGGISQWDNASLMKEAYKNSKYGYEIALLVDVKNMIYRARNGSFHFTTLVGDDTNWNHTLISNMFNQEAQCCATIEKKKFYSNNLPLFYDSSSLKGALDTLYSKYANRAAQIPAFNQVCVRKNFVEFIAQELHIQNVTMTESDRLKWHSALYYLCKQIYYQDFLQSGKAKKLFLEECEGLSDFGTDKDSRAHSAFKRRCNELSELSLPQICQCIMTEYNAQNTGNMKVRTANESPFDKVIFKHYPLLLKKLLGKALAKYILGKPEYAFIKKPSLHDQIEEERFLPDWSSNMYQNLQQRMKSDVNLQQWYVVCRFLNPTSLNQLVGSMRSYVQYVEDVKRRAKACGTVLNVNEDESIKTTKELIELVDMCIKLTAGASKKFDDYFKDADDYATYLEKYIDFDLLGSNQVSKSAALLDFCNREGRQFDFYMDGQNPILNANVITAKLYGPADIISHCYQCVTEDDVLHYYDTKDKIANYLVKGKCQDDAEQKELIRLQRMKNHIELRDVATYSEIVNELLGQLINWSVIRERDLLYFQLGFHYQCLMNPDAYKPEAYVRIQGTDGTIINNAILYQIAAMSINGIGVYSPNKEKIGLEESNRISSGGGSFKQFSEYTEYIMREETKIESKKENKYNVTFYNAGLEAFEVISEHNEIINTRNAIDHFRYYTGDAGSILDLYSKVFDQFFTNDMKYRKNVLNVLENILLKQCCVILEPKFETDGIKHTNAGDKKAAKIGVQKLSSDKYTYKCGNGEVYTGDTKSKEFLETVARLLYYPNNMPEDCRIMSDDSIKKARGKAGQSQGNHGQRENRREDTRNGGRARNDKGPREYHDNTPVSDNPFAAFFKNNKV